MSARVTAVRLRQWLWLLVVGVVLSGGWIVSATASAAPSCTFTALPADPQPLGENPGLHPVALHHQVAVTATCGRVSSSSADSSWVYSDERVTTSQHMRTFGIADGFGLMPIQKCTFNPLFADCPILTDNQGSDGYSSEVDLFYSKPLQCDASTTSVHVAMTLIDPNSGATETVPGTGEEGPCAGRLGLAGVPRRCATGTFKIRERVPHSLAKLLSDAYTFGASLDVLKLGPRGPRPVDVPLLTQPDAGFLLRDGAAITIFAGKLQPGDYELHMYVFEPSDYPSVFAKFRRC